MPAREQIDIEALLFRAYGEKKVHRLRDAKAGALGLMMPRGAGGGFSTAERVDTSSFSARVAGELRELQGRLGAAPSGLIDLHDVVLGLETVYVERGEGLDFAVWWDADAAHDRGHKITDDQDGARIVEMRRRGGRGPGRDDMLPAGPARRLTKIVTSTLVILHGQYGDRPFVPEVEVHRMRPVYEGASKEAKSYSPEYVTPLSAVVEGRASYAVWREALSMLAQIFARSTEYEVTGPRAPAAPWECDLPRRLEGGRARELSDRHPDDPDEPEAAKKPARKPRTTKKNHVARAA